MKLKDNVNDFQFIVSFQRIHLISIRRNCWWQPFKAGDKRINVFVILDNINDNLSVEGDK